MEWMRQKDRKWNETVLRKRKNGNYNLRKIKKSEGMKKVTKKTEKKSMKEKK